jgi:integrase
MYRQIEGKKVFAGKYLKADLFTTRTMRRSCVYHMFYRWHWGKDRIQTVLGSKDIEVLEVYIRKQRKDKLQLFI